jgi:signal peptidase II
MNSNRWYALAAVAWILDRATKAFVNSTLMLGQEVPVLPIFSWVRLHNEGAAFSFLDDASGWQRWVFVALAIGFAAYLVTEIRKLPANERLLGWAYGFVLGGALGNMWDRLMHGYVIDFALAHYGDHYFPAFNVADSAISIGATLWILAMLRDARADRDARTT